MLTPRREASLSVAVVGLGRWGLNYCRTLRRISHCRLTAVVDVDETRLAAADSALHYSSIEALLGNPDVDAVIVATPETTHSSIAWAALAADRDVMVEKPLARDIGEAEELVSLASERKRILAVGHTAVYGRGFAQMLNTQHAPPSRMDSRRTSAGSSNARSTPDAVLWDLAPHDVAMAVLLAGLPTAARTRPGPEPAVRFEVRFASGATLAGTVAWQQPLAREFSATYCTRGSVLSSEPLNGTGSFTDLPLSRQCDDFIQSCRTRTPPLSNGLLGLVVTRTLCALGNSSGDWVPVGPPYAA